MKNGDHRPPFHRLLTSLTSISHDIAYTAGRLNRYQTVWTLLCGLFLCRLGRGNMSTLYRRLSRIGGLHLGGNRRSSACSGFLDCTGSLCSSGLCASGGIDHGRDLVYRSIASSLCVLGHLGGNALTGSLDLLAKLVAIGIEGLHGFRGKLLRTLGNRLTGFPAVVYHRVDNLGGTGGSCLHELAGLFLNVDRARKIATLLVDDFAQKRTVLGTGTGRKEQTGDSAYCAAYNERCELAHVKHLPQEFVVDNAIIKALPCQIAQNRSPGILVDKAKDRKRAFSRSGKRKTKAARKRCEPLLSENA